MKVLITGSYGKVGYEILKYLSLKKITCIANYRKKKFLLKNDYIKNYKCNILSKSFSLNNASTLIHCASLVNKNKKTKYFFNINKKINTLLKNNKTIKKIIFLSSAAVYSNVNFKKKINEYSKILSNELYAKEKIYAEKMFLKHKNIEVYNLRLPAIIGTHREDNFFSNLVKKIKLNKSIKLYNPNQLFNNILIILSLNKFILNLLSNKYKSGNILLGSSSPLTLNNIVKIIRSHFKQKYDKVHWEEKKDTGFYLDIQNAIKYYKFKPIKTRQAINYYLKKNDIQK